MNKILLNALYILLFITSCNNISSEKKNDKPSDNISSNDITKENDIKKDDVTNNDVTSKKIFFIKEGEVYINCKYINNNDLNTKQKLFDIELVKENGVKSMIAIDENYADYLSKAIERSNSKSFYHSSPKSIPCSAIIYFVNEDETSSWYLFEYDTNGKLVDKMLLSHKVDDITELVVKSYSEIVQEENLVRVTLVKNMLDDYVDQNNYSELVDSIVSNYSLEEGKLQLKSKDSTRQKVEVKQ
ncbi:hypothetical protein [Aquimarina algiphila]|uniref:Lipoprotein n=1 Tax=Aquimarina algiphila TaxID=2047982 RepID=A0A554VB83_9FLAO|nr:hypothetical protein [Aquimarina algiphila]TSE03746.1 hypothetical protein FOF46_28655 [Aquimarina algiphila]